MYGERKKEAELVASDGWADVAYLFSFGALFIFN